MSPAFNDEWGPGTTIRFLLVANLLNRLGLKGNPRQLLKIVILPLSLAAWLILAITLAVLLPQWAPLLHHSFPQVEGLPGFTGEYYLLVFALVPVWLDSITRLSTIFFGASSFQKVQVPSATLQLLGIDRKAYFWHAHQVVTWVKVAFVVLPLVSVLVWASTNTPTVLLGLALLGIYSGLVAVEAAVTFRRVSLHEPHSFGGFWSTLTTVLVMVALGYISLRLVLAGLASLNIGMPGTTLNPHVATGVLTLARPTVALSLAGLGLLITVGVYAWICCVPACAVGVYTPARPHRDIATESGVFFPVVGLQYFYGIFTRRAGLISFFSAGALCALGKVVEIPPSFQTAVTITALSYVVGSTFEQTLPLSFSRSRERYRFMYEVGTPMRELVPKIAVAVTGSALPGLTVASAGLVSTGTSVADALMIVIAPALGLLGSDSFLSTRVRAEGIRFTFIALAQMAVSLLMFAATLLPAALTFLIFISLVAATALAARKAILCMN